MNNHPDLEPRFLPPPGWQWRHFKNRRGRNLRYGFALPENHRAAVVGLQGLSEFTEKYFETANDLLSRNIGFFMMDWQGQGHSDRHLPNPHKRHATSFDEDIADLHEFIGHVRKETGAPLAMLAHSMGSNIGLRYLHRHKDVFSCAAFSAPMIGIDALKLMPRWFSLSLTSFLTLPLGPAYVGFRYGDWKPLVRENPADNIFSSDPKRRAVHNAWYLHDPRLQVGNITFKWLHEASLSCARLCRVMPAIETPCLFALAGKEKLVDNACARRLIRRMPKAEILELPDSLHEILMERDDIRNRFFAGFYALMEHAGPWRHCEA